MENTLEMYRLPLPLGSFCDGNHIGVRDNAIEMVKDKQTCIYTQLKRKIRQKMGEERKGKV